VSGDFGPGGLGRPGGGLRPGWSVVGCAGLRNRVGFKGVAMRGVFCRAVMAAGAAAVVVLGAATGAAARTSPAVLAFHPAPYDYGQVRVGQRAAETFTLVNTGGRASGALTVTVSGSAAFTITAGTCRSSLGPGKKCTVRVRFAPARAGAVTGTLRAASKKHHKHQVLASDTLTGTGKGLGGAPGDIYWANQVPDGTINAAPLAGGTPTTLVTGQIFPAGVAVDASHIYWADTGKTGFPGTIWEAPLTGSPAAIVATGQDNPAGVAVDSSHIYWADQGNGTLWEAPLAGGPPTFLNSVSKFAEPAGVAVDSSHVYWANFGGDSIDEAPLTPGGPVTTLVGGQNQPWGVAVDGSHIYWADQGGGGITSGTIMEANLNGTGVTTLATGQNRPAGVAVDSSHIYWANNGGITIDEAPLTGGTPTTLVTGQPAPTGVAVSP
jgi:hypothetical protein